jgi:hypothetical protein
MYFYIFITIFQGDSGSPLFYLNLIIGVNFGTAPTLEQGFHARQVNIHLHISYYYGFMTDIRSFY